MVPNLDALKKRFQELNEALLNANLDRVNRQALQKEHSYLSAILSRQAEIEEVQHKIEAARKELETTTDVEMKALFEQELADLQQALKDQEKELEDALFPPDELDSCAAYVEIRAGAGGQEAALFVADLLRMYSNYGLKKGWTVSLVDFSETDLKGFKEVIAHVKGKNAYGMLKFESGVHRVQRVPQTETSGRVHTSTVTVAVFPEVDENYDVEIKPDDIRIDYYRASGAGGQHVNKTESAVRITHIPTGIVVACQDDRSQHKNKATAFKVLKSRIVIAQKQKQEEEMALKRKEQVGRGMRAEKARTYNYPQNRVTDHAAEVSFSNLDMIMEGDMDKLIAALQEHERNERRKNPPQLAI